MDRGSGSERSDAATLVRRPSAGGSRRRRPTAAPVRDTRTWHALSATDVLRALGSRHEGLSDAEASDRLLHYGPNRLPERGRRSLLLIVLRQLNNPLTAILFVAAIVSYVLGDVADAMFIALVVIVDVTIGATQEARAEASASSLKQTLHIAPIVVRGGVRRAVTIDDIVPGDVVRLESGVVVPADLRLLAAHDLRVDESLLTGESATVKKQADIQCDIDAMVGDRRNIAYAGTMVSAGRGVGVVCATGAAMEIGEISRLLVGSGTRSPLLIRMEGLSKRIGVFTILIAVMIGAGEVLRGEPLAEALVLMTALAVSAIPEGLPMAITATLSIASNRMGKRHVIVRHLPAVEALGSCTLIASDKTGTLTANRLTVKRIVLADGSAFEVEGEGLETDGAIQPADAGKTSSQTEAHLKALAISGALANEAALFTENGAVEAAGDAVDIAFLVFAKKLGVARADICPDPAACTVIPYEPERGFSACRRQDAAGGEAAIKGAPEIILPMCRKKNARDPAAIVHALAADGFRVIAVAEKRDRAPSGPDAAFDLDGFSLLGFAGLIDPLRSEAPSAVAEAQAAGVDVRMITGDHPETALAIAKQLGLARQHDIPLTGAQLKELPEEKKAAAIAAAKVFARVEPTQKNEIVKSLQEAGHFVAVTGDGVNDAPALKTAHVGVAMGAGGADVARAASDLIITDDNFASIVAGIEEGRAAYENIRKIVWLLLSTAVSEVLIFALALFAGLPIPLTAVQILWLNLVSEGIQDVALAFEGKEPDLMRRPPRRPSEPVFNRQMIEQCLLVGLYIGGLAFGIFFWLYKGLGYTPEAARNITLLFMICFQNVQTLNCRSERRSIFKIPFKANPFLIWGVLAAQGVHIAAMYIPLTERVLEIEPVSLPEWSLVLALAMSVIAVCEFYKLVIVRPSRIEMLMTTAA